MANENGPNVLQGEIFGNNQKVKLYLIAEVDCHECHGAGKITDTRPYCTNCGRFLDTGKCVCKIGTVSVIDLDWSSRDCLKCQGSGKLAGKAEFSQVLQQHLPRVLADLGLLEPPTAQPHQTRWLAKALKRLHQGRNHRERQREAN